MEPKKQMKLKNKEVENKQKPEPKLEPIPQVSDTQVKTARGKVEQTFKKYHELLVGKLSKVLKRNKSEQVKDEENKTTQDLINAAAQLDQVNIGEGTMIVGSIGLRELLLMRDRINELEYELALLKKGFKEHLDGANKTDGTSKT